jgi:hypothetical protein
MTDSSKPICEEIGHLVDIFELPHSLEGVRTKFGRKTKKSFEQLAAGRRRLQ